MDSPSVERMYPIRGRGPAPERGQDPLRKGDSDGPGKATGETEEKKRIMIMSLVSTVPPGAQLIAQDVP